MPSSASRRALLPVKGPLCSTTTRSASIGCEYRARLAPRKIFDQVIFVADNTHAHYCKGKHMAIKAVLVTGTSSGIGYSIAAELPKHGYHVIATMRDPRHRNADAAGRLVALAKGATGRCDVVEIDVTSDASVAAGGASAVSLAGRVDRV